MPTREIAGEDWREFFDRVSEGLRGKSISIEIDSLDIGAQVEGKGLVLQGLTYDPKDACFTISTDVIEHSISAPQQIFVADGDAGVNSLEVVTADNERHIISFSEPLALPAP